MKLQQLARVIVQFAPGSPSSRTAREFYRRCSGTRAQASNPDCQVEARVRLEGDSVVHVTYANGERNSITINSQTAGQIEEVINSVSEQMTLKDMLKEAGVNPVFGKPPADGSFDTGTMLKTPHTPF